MIPLKLSLRNFMSYRDAAPELDLEGVHVVCLCGDNGHGKSALLDAITWALWGSVRGVSAGTRGLRTDELVHMGQPGMEVVLEFLAGETRYNVVRKHGRARHGPGAGGMLDLQVATGAGFRSISESSMAATQQKLTRILRMDYETFINTAFLLQGQADRFTRAEPMRRKEVLAEILGLSLYDRLATRSRQQANDYKAQAEQASAALQRLDQELATRGAAQEQLHQATASLETLLPHLEEADRRVEAVRVQLALLARAAQEERRLRQDLDARRTGLQEMEQRLGRLEAQRVAYEKALAQREAVLLAESTYRRKRQELQEADTLATPYHNLQAQLHQHQRTVDVARAQLEAEAQAADRKLAELEARAASAQGHQHSLQEADALLTASEAQATQLQAQREGLHSLRADERRLEAEGKALAEEMSALQTRLDLLLAQREAVCPLCGTALGPEGRTHVQREKEAQGKALQQRYAESQAFRKERQARAQVLAQELSVAEPALRRRREDALRRQERASHGLQEAAAASGQRGEAQRAVAELRARLASGAFAQQAQEALQQAQAEAAALGYDPALHQQLRDQVSALAEAPERARMVREAEQRLPETAKELISLSALISQTREILLQNAAELQALGTELHDRSRLVEEEAKLSRERQALQQRHQDAQAIVARCEARLSELEDRERQKTALQTTMTAVQSDRATHELLADAFGRNGLQAMLIDEVLPDLEADANELLARLSDGRMTLKLETQRLTRRGSAVETLELLVADELGTRSYDLFSGGEAFRISFALRVALARLLARRAGAPFRTLLVDEGFGTQDASGRERLVEAIKAIQDDFDLIIAITHLEEVKEAFPVRIEVTKTAAGSTFQLVT